MYLGYIYHELQLRLNFADRRTDRNTHQYPFSPPMFVRFENVNILDIIQKKNLRSTYLKIKTVLRGFPLA